MGNLLEIPPDWTESEQWVWQQIAAGEPADLNARGPDKKVLDPHTKKGWGEDRRLSAKFLQTILTQKAFVQATPYGGVRILGALIDDAPLNLEHARLQYLFWLEKSRILTDVRCRNLRVDGGLAFEDCFVAAAVDLNEADIRETAFLKRSTFKGGLDLMLAKIGSNLEMNGSTFEGEVTLDSTTVSRSASLCDGSTFKGKVYLEAATIGTDLDMYGSTFEGEVYLRAATIGTDLDMHGSTFEGEVYLGAATIGTDLDMHGSTFEGEVYLRAATIGTDLDMHGSTFEGEVYLGAATIGIDLEMHGSTFEGEVYLGAATIGTDLDMYGSTFIGAVDLTGCTVTGNFLLGYSEATSARWEEGASLTLRNSCVGAFQDWWWDDSANAWPKTYQLEGFSYDRLGSIGVEKGADMLDRPVSSYIQWLKGDRGSSPQPYEHLANRFHEAGEPHKATDILYAARERRRSKAWSTVDDCGLAKQREWSHAIALSGLRLTIGYGLGNRYFRVLWWVGGLTLVGAFVLIFFGSHSLGEWPRMLFASLDQLLPIITLDKAHDVLIFGDPSVKPLVEAQPYGVLVYFYAHKILGWVLGSFLVAGLAGLTQRN